MCNVGTAEHPTMTRAAFIRVAALEPCIKSLVLQGEFGTECECTYIYIYTYIHIYSCLYSCIHQDCIKMSSRKYRYTHICIQKRNCIKVFRKSHRDPLPAMPVKLQQVKWPPNLASKMTTLQCQDLRFIAITWGFGKGGGFLSFKF